MAKRASSKLAPGTHRSTTLKLGSRHCPLAITHYLNGVEYDRRFYATGTSAHANIQAVIEATNAMGAALDEEEIAAVTLTVCEQMIRDGRMFEGVPEGPLKPESVWEGRALAMRYCAQHPIEPTDELIAEKGLAVDADWSPVPYSKDAWFRAIADLMFIRVDEDEERRTRMLVHRDFKSAWPTNAGELDTVQLKMQSVLAWKHHGEDEDVDGLRQEVTNLRTGVTYGRNLFAIDNLQETLDRWQEEVDATMRALDDGRDADGRYKASPGGGCTDCPYLANCEEGKVWCLDALEHKTTEERGIAYSVMKSRAAALMKVLKQETADGSLIRIGGGKVVGAQATTTRTVAPGGELKAFAEWKERGGEIDGFITGLGLGVGQIDSIAKTLFPEPEMKEERDAWAATLCGSKGGSKFSIHNDDDPDLLAALQASLTAKVK